MSLCAGRGRSVGAALLITRNLYQGLVCAHLLPIAQPVTKQSLKQELNICRKSAVQMTRDEVQIFCTAATETTSSPAVQHLFTKNPVSVSQFCGCI